jgi:DNA protecting protein DprA
MPKRSRPYIAPATIHACSLDSLLTQVGRAPPENSSLLRDALRKTASTMFYAGDFGILIAPAVSIVGARKVSDEGWHHTIELARDLAKSSVTVVSDLTEGVNMAALTGTMAHGGRVTAVIGTPLDKVYPSDNADVQQMIYEQHLLMTPIRIGQLAFRYKFPLRNRIMAAISDATVIIEASDTSAALHQAAECVRLGRWLFIAKSVAEDASLAWPDRYLGRPKIRVLASSDDLMRALADTGPAAD